MDSSVSNTEVTTRLICEKQHFYRFILGLEPKPHKLSVALRRGIIGHKAMEAYYTVIMNGGSVDEAFRAAKKILQDELAQIIIESPEDDEAPSIIKHLIKVLERYVEFYEEDPFEVLAVEKIYTTPVDAATIYGMRLDVLIRMTKGTYFGDIIILDHKFCYNFKSEKELMMNGQIPKYVHTLQKNKIRVSKGIFNQIRYRELKNDNPNMLFRRTELKPNKNQLNQIWEEQKDTVLKINEIKKEFAETGEIKPPPKRVMSDLICKYCPFVDPCFEELQGKDISMTLQAGYRPSTYGYGKYVNLATGE